MLQRDTRDHQSPLLPSLSPSVADSKHKYPLLDAMSSHFFVKYVQTVASVLRLANLIISPAMAVLSKCRVLALDGLLDLGESINE